MTTRRKQRRRRILLNAIKRRHRLRPGRFWVKYFQGVMIVSIAPQVAYAVEAGAT